MTMPPRVVPCPPTNLVSEWMTMSAPWSKGLEAHGRGHGVVDDERHPVAVGGVGHRLDVDHVAGRVADALAENGLGLVVDQGLDGLGAVVGGKAGFHAFARQDGGEIGVSGAVKLGRGHDIGAQPR